MQRSRSAPYQCVSVSVSDRGRGHDCEQRVPVPLRGSRRTRHIKRPEHGSLTDFSVSDESYQQLSGLGN